MLGRALGISLWKERRQDRGQGEVGLSRGAPGDPAGCQGRFRSGDGSSVIPSWAKGSLGPWLWAAALGTERDGDQGSSPQSSRNPSRLRVQLGQ